MTTPNFSICTAKASSSSSCEARWNNKSNQFCLLLKCIIDYLSKIGHKQRPVLKELTIITDLSIS